MKIVGKRFHKGGVNHCSNYGLILATEHRCVVFDDTEMIGTEWQRKPVNLTNVI